MDSPKSTHSDGSDCGRHTPKSRNVFWSRFNGPDSPQMCGNIDVDDVGWDDSPEPLKLDYYAIAVPPKKVASSETPISHRKRRTVRTSKRQSLAYTAEKDLEIIKKITRSILGDKFEEGVKNEQPCLANSATCISANESIITSKDENTNYSNTSTVAVNKPSSESIPDGDLQSFFQEDDDILLSQVELNELCRTPRHGKGGLVKSRSAELNSPSPGRSNSLRRFNSFQPSVEAAASSSSTGTGSQSPTQPQLLKKQKSFHVEPLPGRSQCTAEQIEQKRQQAIYRREHKEIERRRLEALRRLNERRGKLALLNSKR